MARMSFGKLTPGYDEFMMLVKGPPSLFPYVTDHYIRSLLAWSTVPHVCFHLAKVQHDLNSGCFHREAFSALVSKLE